MAEYRYQSNNLPLVTVIMPAYNAAKFIGDAIRSVITQTYQQWELLIVNDGSHDDTVGIIQGFDDSRIRYFNRSHAGVAAARNVGLDSMKGEFVCFLDADDVLPANSIKDRLEFLRANPEVSFVDGMVYVTSTEITDITRTWMPAFKGIPRNELLQLRDSCFITISWMMRRAAIGDVRFREVITHGEDLVFLAEISGNGVYDFVLKPTLYFRRTGSSAMSNLDGLADGYLQMFRIFRAQRLFPSITSRYRCKFKMLRIMFLSYFMAGKRIKAFDFLMKGLMA